MLSGNGRHRRPRQAPALVVAAGVTGSAIAIPLLGATGAGAATATTWDKVAECESGGQWSLDSGDGYYGGLQFSQEVWEQYGGLDYAPRADQASRSQQIAVAEKVLDDKGPTAWPGCSVTAGLAKGDGSADVDPGASATPQPSDSADANADSDADSGDKNHDESGASDKASGKSSGKASGKSSDDASDEATQDASSRPSDEASDGASADSSADTGGNSADDDASTPSGTAPSNSPAATDSSGSEGASSGGRHRGDPAADDADSRTGDGRHASRGEQRDDEAYVVRSGDSLWDIADAHDVRGGWSALYDANKKTVGTDPDLILPGQSLDLGPESVEK
ncbi:transglycosylase family protein [Streptomyces sp. NPDC001904]|uniref:transglycosylase family protein n=1 Tax=Streptomyces sp. NPDC001904 TaxID=3154531 RepID=UPI00333178DA